MTPVERARAETADGRRIEDVEKENAALRARLRRLEAESENTNLLAKIDRLEARRHAAPRKAEVQPAPAAPVRLEASAPERTLILADMPVKASPAIAPRLPDWSGIYVGFEGGYGWGKQDTNTVFPGAPFLGGSGFPDIAFRFGSLNGWLLGGFAGAQRQWGSFIFGVETDFDAAALKNSMQASATNMVFIGGVGGLACGGGNTACLTQTVSGTTNIDALGSLRGKVGFVPTPNLLIYGTGGLGFAHVKNDFTVTNSILLGPVQQPPLVSVSTGGMSMLGWAAGGGVEWKWPVDAGSAVVFGVEYLHYDFGTQTITISNNAGASSAFHSSVSADTVKGRISYLFNVH